MVPVLSQENFVHFDLTTINKISELCPKTKNFLFIYSKQSKYDLKEVFFVVGNSKNSIKVKC